MGFDERDDGRIPYNNSIKQQQQQQRQQQQQQRQTLFDRQHKNIPLSLSL